MTESQENDEERPTSFKLFNTKETQTPQETFQVLNEDIHIKKKIKVLSVKFHDDLTEHFCRKFLEKPIPDQKGFN